MKITTQTDQTSMTRSPGPKPTRKSQGAARTARALRKEMRNKATHDFKQACDQKVYEPAERGEIETGDIVEIPNPAVLEAEQLEREDFVVITTPPKFSEGGHLEQYGCGLIVRNAHGADYDRDASREIAKKLSAVIKTMAAPEGFSSEALPGWGKDYTGNHVDRPETATLLQFAPSPELPAHPSMGRLKPHREPTLAAGKK